MASFKNVFLMALALAAAIVSIESSPLVEVRRVVKDEVIGLDVHRVIKEEVPDLEVHRLAKEKAPGLELGERVPGDYLFHEELYVKTPNVISSKYTIFTFPDEVITYVKLVNQSTNGHPAKVTLLEGGPGYQNISLLFVPQADYGIKYFYQIYAVKVNPKQQ